MNGMNGSVLTQDFHGRHGRFRGRGCLRHLQRDVALSLPSDVPGSVAH